MYLLTEIKESQTLKYSSIGDALNLAEVVIVHEYFPCVGFGCRTDSLTTWTCCQAIGMDGFLTCKNTLKYICTRKHYSAFVT